MFIVVEFLRAVIMLVEILANLMIWLIIIRALISWVNPDPYNPIVTFLNGVTEPVLRPFRRFMPAMPVDLSPILASVVIIFAKNVIIQILFRIIVMVGG